MNFKIYKLKTIQLIVMLIVSLIFIVIIITGLSSYESRFDGIETDRIKETVEKYAIQCYATEGAYPPNVQYLSDHYGLILNDKYIYEYEPIAENIKPIVQVFLRIGYGEE